MFNIEVTSFLSIPNASEIEKEMFQIIFPNENSNRKDIYLREINEEINESGIACDLVIIKDILNYWAQISCIKKERIDKVNNQYRIRLKIPYDNFKKQMKLRISVGSYCLKVLEQKFLPLAKDVEGSKDKKLLEFSVLDLKIKTEEFIKEIQPLRFYEYILLYFHNLKIIDLKDGLMVFYNPMKITRRIEDNRKRYTQEDYHQLARYYESKTEQIHIVGEYAKKQLRNNIEATQFVEDYFSLPYESFLGRYFNRRKGAIKKTITEEKFREIFSELSTEQLSVVKDDKNDNILVAAGPGSGKTRVLVHKVASLLLMEDVKPEQFLMLTFSRPAALEFKSRLKKLVGIDAFYTDIFTYHGFAFQLAGRLGNIKKAQNILRQITTAIEQREIPVDRIMNKSVVVVDEYQDVSQEEYDFLMAIVKCSEKIRIIAAGDDDQNIYEFRGSSVQFMRDFIMHNNAQKYILTKNYRANHNLLAFTNQFLRKEFSAERIKFGIDLIAHKQRNGSIEIIKYKSDHLIIPLINQVLNKSLKGSIAILTYKNEEAILIASLLKENNFPAVLISEKQGVALRDLLEIKTFTHFLFQEIQDEFGLIAQENWDKSKNRLFEMYKGSKNIDLVRRIIDSFENTNPKKFKSTWVAFLKEIKVEDFYFPEKNKILVSTMHKSKGKEFDHVFILLNQYPVQSAEKKRVLYVAMTRAKENLFIHTNNIDFSTDGILSLENKIDEQRYFAPDKLIIECSMQDVWLGYFKNADIIFNVKKLKSGDSLQESQFDKALFRNVEGHNILKLSKKMQQKINGYYEIGYQLDTVYVKNIVVWYDEESDKSYRVVLPEIVIRRN
ncbi:MAG: ATP-dependent helicase [Bacteroidota bacterium]